MQQHQLKGSLMLFFCALIWGLAFVAQSVGADHVGAFTFNGLRSLIGAVFLIPCVAFFDRLAGRPFSIWGTDNKTEQQDLITGGIVCGIGRQYHDRLKSRAGQKFHAALSQPELIRALLTAWSNRYNRTFSHIIYLSLLAYALSPYILSV